jgi:hypothetical protein
MTAETRSPRALVRTTRKGNRRLAQATDVAARDLVGRALHTTSVGAGFRVGAGVVAAAAVVLVVLQVDANSAAAALIGVTRGIGGEATAQDPPDAVIAIRAERTFGVTGAAMVLVRGQIAARAGAASVGVGCCGRPRAGVVTPAAVVLVVVEVLAPAAAVSEAVLALAITPLALCTLAAVAVPIAALAHLLAVGGHVATATRQEQAEPGREEGLAGRAAGDGEGTGESVKPGIVHGGLHLSAMRRWRPGARTAGSPSSIGVQPSPA